MNINFNQLISAKVGNPFPDVVGSIRGSSQDGQLFVVDCGPRHFFENKFFSAGIFRFSSKVPAWQIEKIREQERQKPKHTYEQPGLVIENGPPQIDPKKVTPKPKTSIRSSSDVTEIPLHEDNTPGRVLPGEIDFSI